MSCPAYRQDLPPSCGYKPIPYKRVAAKTYFSGTYIRRLKIRDPYVTILHVYY